MRTSSHSNDEAKSCSENFAPATIVEAGVNDFLRLGLMASGNPRQNLSWFIPGPWGCLPASVMTTSRI